MIVVEETSAQDAKEDGKRATSREAAGAPAAKKSKPSTLSTAEQAFVNQLKPPVAKIADKTRKIPVRWVKGKRSTKQQGARVNDVKTATLAKRPDKFPGQCLSVVGGQLWCGACYSNVGSAIVSIKQHVNGREHIKKVQIKTAGSESGTQMLRTITEYKETVKDNTSRYLLQRLHRLFYRFLV